MSASGYTPIGEDPGRLQKMLGAVSGAASAAVGKFMDLVGAARTHAGSTYSSDAAPPGTNVGSINNSPTPIANRRSVGSVFGAIRGKISEWKLNYNTGFNRYLLDSAIPEAHENFKTSTYSKQDDLDVLRNHIVAVKKFIQETGQLQDRLPELLELEKSIKEEATKDGLELRNWD